MQPYRDLLAAAIAQAIDDAAAVTDWQHETHYRELARYPYALSAKEAHEWLANGRGANWLLLLGIVTDEADLPSVVAGAIARRREELSQRLHKQTLKYQNLIANQP